MAINVGLDRNCMSLYEIKTNLNHFAVILHILLHLIIRVIDIKIMDDLRYNVQLYIYCTVTLYTDIHDLQSPSFDSSLDSEAIILLPI